MLAHMCFLIQLPYDLHSTSQAHLVLCFLLHRCQLEQQASDAVLQPQDDTVVNQHQGRR